MVSGTRDTLPPGTTLPCVHMMNSERHKAGNTPSFVRNTSFFVYNEKFLLSMRRSKKLPLEAEANKRKLFTWTKVVPPTRVTLFRKQGVPTARVIVPAETK